MVIVILALIIIKEKKEKIRPIFIIKIILNINYDFIFSKSYYLTLVFYTTICLIN